MTRKRERILIVDDEETIRRLLHQKLTSEGYQCREAKNADQALDELKRNSIGLVLLDIKMPGKSGVELLPEIRVSYPDTAVMMATAIADSSTAIQCMKEGAYDYITKPFNLDEVVLSVDRTLEKRRLELENRDHQQHLEQMVTERTAELKQAISKIKLASLDTIHRLAQAAEYKDENTGAHIKRMSQYSAIVARKMGLSDSEVENILYAAPMHDVGKIGIPDRILLKTGRLDANEWEIMKKHTVIGAEILRGSDAEFIRLAEVIALTHHEKWDGSGYPRGLQGSEIPLAEREVIALTHHEKWDGSGYPRGLQGSGIPLAGRIVAITDAFDALTSKRPYKKAFSIEKSLKIIKEGRGSHFDPEVVDAFFAIEDEIFGIKKEYKDERESLLVRMTR